MAGASNAEAAAIKGIRPTNEGASTRIVIEVTETTPYRWGLVPADPQKGLPPRFFVDIEGHQNDPQVGRALTELARAASMYKVLGSYPRAVL